jgi:hypothetical protein
VKCPTSELSIGRIVLNFTKTYRGIADNQKMNATFTRILTKLYKWSTRKQIKSSTSSFVLSKRLF